MATQPLFAGTAVNKPVTITNADGTTKKQAVQAGAIGARLDSLHICSDDTASVNLDFYATVSGVDYFIGRVHIPAGAGYDLPWQEGLATLNNDLSMSLAAGTLIKAAATSAVTAGKTVTIFPMSGDF